MRLLFVVQRYGPGVAGGAEQFCREFATRLVARGHQVEVVTSCATNYTDWSNEFPEGTTELDGVVVHRLPVTRPRDNTLFTALYARTVLGAKPVPLFMQREWMRQQGPYVEALPAWIEREAGRFDIAVFFTYLYYTTWAGLPAAAGLVPTVLHPTAHDEPPLYLPVYDTMVRQASAFGFLTEEEGDLVRRRFRLVRPSRVIGIGTDLDIEGDGDRFRRDFGVDDAPYLLYVGRVDPHKGSVELFDHFAAYKQRNPGPLKLVIMGDPVHPLPPHPDVVVTGFVEAQQRLDAMAGALALVHPSYFESFSMVLTEAWALRTPAIVQGRCAVLEGQCRRSGGGVPYVGFAEFEAAVDLLVGDADLRRRLGENGRAYVERRYRWDDVLSRYERFLTGVLRLRAVSM